MQGLFLSLGSPEANLTDEELSDAIIKLLEAVGPRDDVMILPPDHTRKHSYAGQITQMICRHYYNNNNNNNTSNDTNNNSEASKTEPLEKKQKVETQPPNIQIMPALGTHTPMTNDELEKMFGHDLVSGSISSVDNQPQFMVHNWRNDVVTIGHVPKEMVSKATYGKVTDQPWPVQLNKHVWEKRLDPSGNQKYKSLVLSIGQVVPHEVMGMANYNKNLLVGTGGVEAIHWSHFIGAVHGMETIMGQAHHPLRDILEHASKTYLEPELDLWYILTVVSPDPESGKLCVRGLFIGNNIECYNRACELSIKVNFTVLNRPIQRCIVYLDPHEFHSTWLGNKAIYRTRLAMADDGELIILAPGVEKFGEDETIDKLIRQYGYRGTPATLKSMDESSELRDNLSVVAHLIHGSSEGRFKITYCTPKIEKEVMENTGFGYADLDEMKKKYNISDVKDGWHEDDGGEFFFINNPAIGLWAVEERLNKNSE